ncbi:MAG: aldolase catalytic domain-containing protein [Methyloceanibacter sp.]|nr:aldolase catalytic domain-containing protein [Methyloceanibacter sp.]
MARILDCTLRDGGYYNGWDFGPDLVRDYIRAMDALRIDVVEIGFRFLENRGFKGAHAFTTDRYLRSLDVPKGVSLGVMVNGADLLTDYGLEPALEGLFPETGDDSPVSLVRIACHYRELEPVAAATNWLADRGYLVGFNLMQASNRTEEELDNFVAIASDCPIEMLYIADSMGGMQPEEVFQTVSHLKRGWAGDVGVHTHDNKGLALQNSLRALDAGAAWVDSTVTGMGRGPGNARTEEVVIEVDRGQPADRGHCAPNMVPLMSLIRNHFQPLKDHHKWGTNAYYFLSGKYGIHPTYVQEMLSDSRYLDEDILAVIDHLRETGGKKYSLDTLEGARNFFRGAPQGTCEPAESFADNDVLIIGSGPSAKTHGTALEDFIRANKPVVVALNTQTPIDPELIGLRAACHPLRLMADYAAHTQLPQPLITPASMLPEQIQQAFQTKALLDYGINIEEGVFEFGDRYCTVPRPLVLAYALAVSASGNANRILLAGFDGYGAGDPRNLEVEEVLAAFTRCPGTPPLVAITPTRYKHVSRQSVYGVWA